MIITVQLLRFSNYLSGFILGKQIDYSALQVVVRWINEALKTAPSGFESIAVQAEKLDSLVRLSSGWSFYDIWNAFLTDVTPPTDGQPLEIAEKVSLFSGSAGKRNSSKHTQGVTNIAQIFEDKLSSSLPFAPSQPSCPTMRPRLSRTSRRNSRRCVTFNTHASSINVPFSF